MDLLVGNDGVENMEISTKTNSVDYAAIYTLQQQAKKFMQFIDGNKSTVKSSASDSTATNDGVENSTKTKILHDAATVPNKTDIVQVAIMQTEDDKCWECDICQKIFSTKGSLFAHKLTHFEKKYTDIVQVTIIQTEDDKCWECDICQKIFSTKGSLFAHKLTHFEKKYTDIRQVTIIQTEDDKCWECDICQKIFSTKGSLYAHKLTHLEKKYACEVCEKKFHTKHVLKLHKRIHSEEKPYACTHCDKKFNNLEKCANHQLTHTKVKANDYEIGIKRYQYECAICKKKFTTTAGANRHKKRVHFKGSDKKMFVADKFPCRICGKEFAHLEYHMLIVHQHSKLLACETCALVFPTHGLMKTHMLLHEQENSKCDVEVFQNHSRLTKHKQLHLVPKKKKMCAECESEVLILHLPILRQAMLKCKKCTWKKLAKNCKVYTNINKNHCCTTLQKERVKKHNLRLKKCGKMIKNGDGRECNIQEKYTADQKELRDSLKISCDICKRNLQSGQSHACCGSLNKVEKMFENLSDPANNLESAQVLTAVDNVGLQYKSQQIIGSDDMSKPQTGAVTKTMSRNIGKENTEDDVSVVKECEETAKHGNNDSLPDSSPQALTDSRWQEIIEIREEENTDDLEFAIEHLENVIYSEIMEEEYRENDCHEVNFTMPKPTDALESLCSKDITSKKENSHEIIYIKEEIDDSWE